MTNMTNIQRKSAMKHDSSSSSTGQEKKQLQWKGASRVRPFKMVSDSERDDVWYTQKDYGEFKKERKAAATLASAIGVKSVEETDFVSCRGIEYMVDQTVFKKQVYVTHHARVAVLIAQLKVFEAPDKLNEEPNLVGSEAILRAYATYSTPAQLDASQRACMQWVTSQEDHGQEETREEESSPSTEDDCSCEDDNMTASPISCHVAHCSTRRPVAHHYQRTLPQVKVAVTAPVA
jgi:hypothetical protein